MKSFFRYLLILSFFSYYIIMILASTGWINKVIDPIHRLHLNKLVKINDDVYLGTYPSRDDLVKYKKDIKLKRVINLLYTNVPLSREVTKIEKPILKELGIEYVDIPISYFSDNQKDYELVNMLITSDPKPTLIHAFLYDKRLKILQAHLKRLSQ